MGISSTIIRDIKKRTLKFEDAEVVHEARQANYEAHDLAMASVSLAVGCYLWFSTMPDVLVVPDVINSK